jgi:hypothetical protein
MEPTPLLHYDTGRRRLWVFGQRCHHGATGAVVAGAALSGLLAHTLAPGSSVMLAVTGSALMAHDWKDRAHWFERGWQSQP